MKKGKMYQVNIDEIEYQPHFIMVYASEDAKDKELQRLATDYILRQDPVLQESDLVDSIIVEPAGYQFPKIEWGVKLGLLYAQAKRFKTEAEAKAFAQWLNPNCEVVPLEEGNDHD